MAIIPNNLVDQLEEKVGDALIQLESVEEVVQAKVNKEMLKEWKAKKLAELQLKEERDGVTQSSKQDRNARASKEWDQYLKELEAKMKADTVNLIKRENAQIVISAWQTSTKEKGIKLGENMKLKNFGMVVYLYEII